MADHGRLRRRFDRLLGYRLQAAFVWLFIRAMRLMSPERASDLGGGLLRRLGRHLSRSRRMRRDIERAMPGVEPARVDAIVAQAWDNLGRTFAEYVHLDRMAADFDRHVELSGAEHLRALATDGRPGIVFTGHFANWELCAMVSARMGLDLTYVFRKPNNPHVARMLAVARAPLGGTMVPKGREAARGLMAAIRAGGHVGLLVDQKLNEGPLVPFLGREARTGTVLADLALRYDAPAVPIRVVRTGAARFRVMVLSPLEFVRTGDMKADTLAAMAQVNALLGDWVNEVPGQWMWQHRRWPD
ncbi:lauroyl acyltransferase [Niveispirillum sp. KHB5.9]|uniref:LpxL/LpxP family acyltransferase n=1 Tax=Niveispirillum sp. KHB5.9 TaxID=3400269 RepID=UPI003A88C154